MPLPTEIDFLTQAVLYLRVSSKKQMDTAVDIDPDGNSIATQRKVATRKANSLGATVVQEFVEPGVSASTIEKRQVFQDMLAFLRENQSVRYVVVYARSRAFRNYIDAAITKRLLDKLNVKLVSAREDFGDGVYADMMEAVTDIFNDVQNKLSGEDIRIKLRHKAENGGTIGRARLGYLNTRIEVEGRMVNTVGLDPERAPLVRKAWELYATGDFSIERLTTTMADLGLTSRPSPRWPHPRPVPDTTLHRMLRDQYYAGFTVYKGSIYPGRHEPIVSQELFDRVQDVLDFRSQRGQRDRILTCYLKGILFCQRCHMVGRTARLIYTEATGKTGRRYGYFLCRARQEGLCDLPHLRAESVEQAIVEHYGTLRLNANFIAEVRQQLDQAVADEQDNVRQLHASLNRRLQELDERESRLIDLAADAALPQSKVRAKLHEVQRDRERVQAGLTNTSEQLAAGAVVLRDALHLVEHPQSLYRDVDDAVRRHLNQTFYERFYIDDLEVVDDQKTPLFADLHGAAALYSARLTTGAKEEQPHEPGALLRSSTGIPTLADLLSVKCSSKPIRVELLRNYSKPVYQGSRLRRLVEMMEQSTNPQVREPSRLPAPHRLDQRLDTAVVQELVAAYKAGVATGELRQRYGLSQGSVLKLLREHDVAMRWRGLTEPDKLMVAELYREGATLAQLGTRFGVSPNVVRRALLAAGVVMRARGGSKPRS